MRILEFEWDDGNVVYLALRHGIEPEEAEAVLSLSPLVRKTKRGHYAAFGRMAAGRLLVIVFASKAAGIVRGITGWDMKASEQKYYRRNRTK